MTHTTHQHTAPHAATVRAPWRRTALVVGGLAVLALSTPTTAYAQTAAPDLAVSFEGPATAVAGSTEVWTLSVSNVGDGAASGFTVSTVVPAGVQVAMSNAPEQWSTCVLGVAAGEGEVSVPSDLSCTYGGELAPGEQAAALAVTLSFAAGREEPLEIGAAVTPAEAEPEAALANNRSTRTTTLSAPPAASVTTPAAVPVTAPAAAPAAAAPAPAAAAVKVSPARVTAAAATPPATLPFTGVGTTERTGLGVLLVLAGIGLLLAGRARPALRTA